MGSRKRMDDGLVVAGSKARLVEDLGVQNRVWLQTGAALAVALGWPGVVAAQGTAAGSMSRPVVQPTSNSERQRLNAALARVARNAKDVSALLEAGDAARALGDFDAALGFYRRADEAQPGNPRVQAGLGSALVMTGDPIAALSNFATAEMGGALPSLIGSDRGLAYDLVGDNVTAQRHYKAALAATTGAAQDQVRQRLAISEAIAGNKSAAQATLMPLLNRQDKPGWRTRAFTLAIAGDTDEAVEVAQKILPAQLAQNIAPYLRYMPRLTKAQQAAAAILGKFPRASEIGRDNARIASFARMAAADTALIPKGDALDANKEGKNSGKTKPSRTDAAQVARNDALAASGKRGGAFAATNPDRAAPPEPRPTIERAAEVQPRSASSGELPPASALPFPLSSVPFAPSVAPTPTPAPSRVATTPAPAGGMVRPGFDLTSVSTTQPAPTPPAKPAPAAATPVPPPASVTASASPPPVPGPGQLSLSEIFADLGKPTIEAMPASGAVDIRNIPHARPQPARPQPKPAAAALAEGAAAPKPADPKAKAKTKAELAKEEKAKARKPAPPSHPSRIWVQMGVGRDKAAVAFDWRRWSKQSPALFKGRSPSVSEMGRTNRVLIGPFETQKAANAFIADAKKAGFDDVLPWTSPAGQVVDPLLVK